MVLAMSVISLVLVLQLENKQNTDTTWQIYIKKRIYTPVEIKKKTNYTEMDGFP